MRQRHRSREVRRVGWREIASGCGMCALYKTQTNVWGGYASPLTCVLRASRFPTVIQALGLTRDKPRFLSLRKDGRRFSLRLHKPPS